LDQSRIEANNKRAQEARKVAAKKNQKNDKEKSSKPINGHPPGGKFPPKPGKGQSNKCTVEGKQNHFHFKSSRWLPTDQQANAATTPAAGTTTSTQFGPSRTQTDPAFLGSNTECQLAFSIFANQFQDAISSLQASLGDRS
jgi:hypothetical protein